MGLGESERIGGSSVLSRPPVRFAPPRPNALGRRGILRFYKFFFMLARRVSHIGHIDHKVHAHLIVCSRSASPESPGLARTRYSRARA
eukprot:scaffold6488_cov250-Isochrysis_galbana.AAC.6